MGRLLPILVLVLGVVLAMSTSMFIVREQDLALKVQLSKIVESTYAPGLHFKVPFVEDVVKFDRRVLTRRFDGEQFLTQESQKLTVDYYIKWQIADASQFYQSTGGDETLAGNLVANNVQDGIKNAVAGRTLTQIVTSDRAKVTGELMEAAGATLPKFGIKLVDVRIQRIDLQDDVAQSVYDSMKRTFEGISRTLRGEGEKESQIVRAGAERSRTELIARAQSDAQRIRGEGDAVAAATYAQAYNRNPEFYAFYRSLQAYKSSLGREGDVLVVSPDSEFFRYFKSPQPRR
jgi:membrane protease subunit HflC